MPTAHRGVIRASRPSPGTLIANQHLQTHIRRRPIMVVHTKRVVRGAPSGAKGEGRPGRATVERQPRFRAPGGNGPGRDARKARAMTKGEMEELKEALAEYEMTRGDFSKAR